MATANSINSAQLLNPPSQPNFIGVVCTSNTTGLALRSLSSNYLLLLAGSSLTGARKLLFNTADADITFTISGTPGINQDVSTTASPTFVGITLTNPLPSSPATDVATGSTLSPGLNYITSNGGSLSTVTLPVTAAKGTYFELLCYGSGGVQINQNSGQTIRFLDVTTTTGTGGSIATFSSNSVFGSIKIMTTTANTGFQVESACGLWNLN